MQEFEPAVLYHVSSSRNRASIAAHGLDVRYMGAARGIAGSDHPEQDGCFIALGEYEMRWFVRMNNTGGPVDVWAVSGLDRSALVVSPENHHYMPAVIPACQLTLVHEDIAPGGWDGDGS
ncbi:hypothetical protein [Tsukamurella ocularis]|uniref:hypothetical protein n=1 Tax=Tsukamurella ocularis TaxID=1970234 RepID=UPI00216987A5|nr:hypothetical protein [Tsukamurella ocularis]MCS3779179.1 hypothetical protein [Tsukamurella ocularis]MCS3787201.1 hypothetical protein [Tsukamurella ocularis]MCS3852592.1 hypothetical protein [Tsukamurella ocularis]